MRFWFAPLCDSLFVCERESVCCVRFWFAAMCASMFVCERCVLCEVLVKSDRSINGWDINHHIINNVLNLNQSGRFINLAARNFNRALSLCLLLSLFRSLSSLCIFLPVSVCLSFCISFYLVHCFCLTFCLSTCIHRDIHTLSIFRTWTDVLFKALNQRLLTLESAPSVYIYALGACICSE